MYAIAATKRVRLSRTECISIHTNTSCYLGHWIQACPTNDDPNFETRPRVKRTTGIPRSFLKTIDKSQALAIAPDGEDSKQSTGVMMNNEGEYVIVEPDSKAWDQYQAKTKASAAAQAAVDAGNKELRERGLECEIDKRMFVDPMKTPCCGRTYCNDCITNALIDSDFVCPACNTANVLLDDLKSDEDALKKIKEFQTEKAAGKGTQNGDAAKSSAVETGDGQANSPEEAKKEEVKETPRSPTCSEVKRSTPETKQEAAKSPASETSTVGSGQSKKRKADETFTGKPIPDGPAAMKKQKSQSQQPNGSFPGNTNMNIKNMPAFAPNMPFNPQMPMGMFPPAMGFPNGMNGMNGMNNFIPPPQSMGQMMGMNPAMMNPMMMMGGFNPNPNQNGGGWNMAGGGGFPPSNNGMYGGGTSYGMDQGGMYGQMMNMGPNGRGGGGQHQQHPQHPQHQLNGYPQHNNNNNMMNNNQFSNQQRSSFGEHVQNDEDNAYFRQPVNPHRHQGRQRRARPSDYREL